MKVAVDSSVLVSALIASENGHDECNQVLDSHQCSAHVHALAETFNTLTGSRLGFRVPANQVVVMFQREVLPRVTFVSLDADETVHALMAAEQRGVRGGAVFDYHHLVAAMKAGAEKFFTLDTEDFRHISRPGDPEIACP